MPIARQKWATSSNAYQLVFVDDNLTESEVLQRISALSLESLGLPLAIQREVTALMGAVMAEGNGNASDSR